MLCYESQIYPQASGAESSFDGEDSPVSSRGQRSPYNVSEPSVLASHDRFLITAGATTPGSSPRHPSVESTSARALGTPHVTAASATAATTPFQSRDVNAGPTDPSNQGALDFSRFDLVCPIDADAISNRWLNPYIPVPGQSIKTYPTNVISFILRVLKSYTSVAVRGRGLPPFVHFGQMQALSPGFPLSTCLSLVRSCDKPLPGADGLVSVVLKQAMGNIFQSRDSFNDAHLLAAYQAYLIYAMVIYFQFAQPPDHSRRQTMMNLQELASSTTRRGLVCAADAKRSRPRWEDWIVAEAKRRAIYVMYLFDSILSAQESLPTFLGTELTGLPAPASKALWHAQTRYDWETAYNVYLAEWPEGGLTIDELWPLPAGMDEPGIMRRNNRVDQWLEDVDEFGTMLYAVTSCTHGV